MSTQLRQVLNRKALADEARRLTLLSIFGAEDEDEGDDEEEDDSDSDTSSEDEEDDDDDESESKTQSFPRAYVEKVRKEAAANRKRANDLEKQLEEIQAKDLSEKEKAEKRAKDAEANAEAKEKQLKALLIGSRVESVARFLEFNDPDDAAALLDLSDLETGDDDLPTTKAIRKALRKLATDKPYLVSDSGSGDGSHKGPNPPADKVKARKDELISSGRVAITR